MHFSSFFIITRLIFDKSHEAKVRIEIEKTMKRIIVGGSREDKEKRR